jgi:hypothetical protein
MVVLSARRACAALLALALIACATFARGDEVAAPTEYGVKAAFLFKFPGYVEWPAAAEAHSLEIGVLESEPMAEELGRIANGRSSAGRAVKVRRLRRGDALDMVDVLFVGRSAEASLAAMLRDARARPILVVTESDGGIGAGGMINFVVEDKKVRFDVALAPAEAAGLKISSRLLSVARRVLTMGDG